MDKPLTIIIFGATGDLYIHKLAPALHDLRDHGLLPPHTSIVAFARRDFTDDSFREFTKADMPVTYIRGNLDSSKDFAPLQKFENKLFYLSTPPATYKQIIEHIIAHNLASGSKILIEKPFGQDGHTAKELNMLLASAFSEEHIFRIDHYVAKNAAQEITDMAIKNGWNNTTIEKVKIMLHEKNTVGNRGAFYDATGAFVDVGQNHMLQLLTLITGGGSSSSASRARILRSVNLKDGEKIVRAQYDTYLQEPGVQSDSQTETFFNCTLQIDNEAWRGVDFELEAGKALSDSRSMVEIYMKGTDAPLLFDLKSIKNPNDAYEKVFLDAIAGRHDTFVSMDEIVEEWRIAEEVKHRFTDTPLVIYKKYEYK